MSLLASQALQTYPQILRQQTKRKKVERDIKICKFTYDPTIKQKNVVSIEKIKDGLDIIIRIIYLAIQRKYLSSSFMML